MKYLHKLGLLFAMASILMCTSVAPASAQDDRRDDRYMQSRHRHYSHRRHNKWWRKHRKHRHNHHHNQGYIRRND